MCWGRWNWGYHQYHQEKKESDERVVVLVDTAAGFQWEGYPFIVFFGYCRFLTLICFQYLSSDQKLPWSFLVWDLKWRKGTPNDFHILLKVLGTLMRICITVRQQLCKLCVLRINDRWLVVKLWWFYYYPWKLRYWANNSPFFSLHDEHRVGKQLRMRVEDWRSLVVNKKITERKQYSMGDSKRPQATSVFTKNQTHSWFLVDDLDKELTLQGQGISYVDHIMGIIFIEIPQGSNHLLTMVMDGKCFTQEVIGHPNHYLRIWLDYKGFSIVLSNWIKSPLCKYIGCLRPVNRWNRPTYKLVTITSSRTS